MVIDPVSISRKSHVKTFDYSNDLNTFLNKAFNVEYVYLILTGIIRIMQAQSKKFQHFKLMK